MAPKWGKRIVRAVNDALLERDRAELRGVEALLAVIEPPRRRRTNRRRLRGARPRRS